MQRELTRCQSLADELASQSLFGANLLETVCHLKVQCDVFTTRDIACDVQLQAFVTKTEEIYELCKTTYCTLYLRMYALLGKSNGRLKNSGVAIDPCSALNIVQWEEQIKVTLYNDNETLFKFATTELLQHEDIEQKTAELELYYTEQCAAIQRYFQLHRELLRHSTLLTLCGMQVAHQIARVKETLQMVQGDDDDTALQPLSVALDQLTTTVETVYLRRRQQVINCQRMVDNCSAKFNCCARLKNTMLRPYYLSRAHCCGPHVKPLF